MKVAVWLLIAVMLMGMAYSFSTCRSEDSGGRTVLVLFDSDDPDYNRMNRERIAIFESENPDIKVKLVTGDPGKYLTMVTGNVAPDVAYAAYQSLAYYAKRKAIRSLEKFVEDDKEFNLEDFFPAAVKSMRYRGELYGLPDSGSPVALIYNKGMFDRYNAGVPPDQRLTYPSGDWTWADFRHAARVLTRDTDGDGRTDEYGCSISLSYNRYPIYVWQNGGEVINAEKTRSLMDSKAAIEAIRWIYEILWVDKSSPRAGTQIEGAGEQNTGDYFKEERLAMLMSTRWAYLSFWGKTNFEWDVAPLPRGPVRNTTIFIGGGWLISKQTRHPEKAWRLAKFLVSEKASEMSMDIGRALAVNRAVAEKMTTDNPNAPPNDHIWVETMAHCRPKDFDIREMGRFFRNAVDEISLISQGRTAPLRTPEQACRNFTRIFNEGLDILWEEEGGP